MIPCTLNGYLTEDKSNMKKIVVLEKDFLDSNGNIPQGKNLDDLFNHIWSHTWKEFQIQEKKKCLAKKKEKKNDNIKFSESENDIEEEDQPV